MMIAWPAVEERPFRAVEPSLSALRVLSSPFTFNVPFPQEHRMTELIWEGKYDSYGKKQSPVRLALPFQAIETVNESAADRQRMLELFSAGREAQWRNRLIWGDKKYVLPSLLPEFAGQVDLVYIDPPFFTGTDQSIVIHISDRGFFEKAPSIVEEAAYRNVWRHGSDSFCQWTYETLDILKMLLRNTGWLFIRHDQYWSHYVKLIADEVFGKDNFRNEIVINRIHKNVTQQGKISIPIATDSLYCYSRSSESEFFDIKRKLDEVREGHPASTLSLVKQRWMRWWQRTRSG
jgi:adenine-specific DNA-methyltransferase